MYSLGTWFVSGICVWIPCIKETMMMMIIIITYDVALITHTLHVINCIKKWKSQKYARKITTL